MTKKGINKIQYMYKYITSMSVEESNDVVLESIKVEPVEPVKEADKKLSFWKRVFSCCCCCCCQRRNHRRNSISFEEMKLFIKILLEEPV